MAPNPRRHQAAGSPRRHGEITVDTDLFEKLADAALVQGAPDKDDPSVLLTREFAEKWGVSRKTASDRLLRLESRGLVERAKVRRRIGGGGVRVMPAWRILSENLDK